MNKNKHLNLTDRITIEKLLNEKYSFKAIGRELSKDCTTISKEVKNRIMYTRKGAYGRNFNNCLYRLDCTNKKLCSAKDCRKKFCKFCLKCTTVCPDFKREDCGLLQKPPYVCNGCHKRNSCTLEKSIYSASCADGEYKTILSESRRGIHISEQEALRLDAIISPLLLKGQSLHNICSRHMDKIMCDERTLYNYVDQGVFTARNIDMPRKIRYRKRKIKRSYKVDKKCRIDRTYEDYLDFIKEHPDTPVVQMDTVEGVQGGKVILTLHFPIPQLMLSFIRDANTSQSVIDIIDDLYLMLGLEQFCKLLPVILCDNGSEFSNPMSIEFDKQGNRRTNLFYCNPSAPYQRGEGENNHEFIRRFIPKGTPLDYYTQADISLMMNHINSYGRKNLGDKSPYRVFKDIYGKKNLEALGVELIPPDEVTLHPSLLKK